MRPDKNKYNSCGGGGERLRERLEDRKGRRAVKCLMGFGLQNVLEITNDQIMHSKCTSMCM